MMNWPPASHVVALKGQHEPSPAAAEAHVWLAQSWTAPKLWPLCERAGEEGGEGGREGRQQKEQRRELWGGEEKEKERGGGVGVTHPSHG